ncbi:hypothetical protein J2X31_000176 [Flavobacterium arsenatis]|uniref:Peptidylprolyl isomerase n=1 Tax=Flavobacterium arsenatis TaxID=1484332 RepID=A0ABU1TJZ0_9FLAO|nr:hypothetical protein [Flavobacterium arsenatis]MDR6966183.1 hypothetical protein [Flavobacterium arsenatis]
MQKGFYIIGLSLLLFSCNYFKPEAKPESIARVGDSFLYKEDIKDLVAAGTSKQDSVLIVKSFIDRWATQKLLIEAANLNLNDEKKIEFDNLIRQYKSDLYTKAYIEEIVKTTVDTVISEKELKEYYDNNKENFRTNGTLVQLRYINLPKDHPKFSTIRSKFLDFRKSDKKFWDTYQIQFKNSALNDSVWVELNEVYRKLPFINPDNQGKYIAEGISFEKPDSLNVYLVKIKKTINKNEISPFVYLKPTLQQVILNRRKLELIKKFEKEITDDAIKNNKYEIYK